MFNVSTQRTDLRIRPLGYLMMLNPILRSKCRQTGARRAKNRKTQAQQIEKHRKHPPEPPLFLYAKTLIVVVFST